MNDFKFTTVVSIYSDGVKAMAGYVMNNMPYVANAVDVGCVFGADAGAVCV